MAELNNEPNPKSTINPIDQSIPININLNSQPPVTSPKKPRLMYLILVAVVLVLGLGTYFYYQKNSLEESKIENEAIQGPVVSNDPESSRFPELNPSKDTKEEITNIPKEDVVYIGNYNGKEVLFNTDKNLQRDIIDGKDVFNTKIGSLTYQDGMSGQNPFEFKNLMNAKEIFTLPQGKSVFNLLGFVKDSQGNIYLGLNLTKLSSDGISEESEGITNYIYKINSSDSQSTLVKEITDANFKDKSHFLISMKDPDYIVFTVAPSADGTDQLDSAVLNLQTAKMQYIKLSKIIDLDVANKLIKYNKLEKNLQKCTEEDLQGMNTCFNSGPNSGYMEVFKPSLKIYSEKLL